MTDNLEIQMWATQLRNGPFASPFTSCVADALEAQQARIVELEADRDTAASRTRVIMHVRAGRSEDRSYGSTDDIIQALTEAFDDRDEWKAKFEAADFGLRNAADLNGEAIAAVRAMLDANDVPKASFIDDHVGNAIFQRNEARDRISALEEALKPFAKEAAHWGDYRDDVTLVGDIPGYDGFIRVRDLRRAKQALEGK